MKPLVHRTLVHCNQWPQSAPNRAIGRQYFGAAYGLLGWTGMSDEARPPGVSDCVRERRAGALPGGSGSVPRHLASARVRPAVSPGHTRPSHWRSSRTSSGAAGRDNFASDRPGKVKRARHWAALAGIVARPVHGLDVDTSRPAGLARLAPIAGECPALRLLDSYMARGTAVKKCTQSC